MSLFKIEKNTKRTSNYPMIKSIRKHTFSFGALKICFGYPHFVGQSLFKSFFYKLLKYV